MKPTYQFYIDGTAKEAYEKVLTLPVHAILDYVKRSRGVKTDGPTAPSVSPSREACDEISKKFHGNWLRTLEADAARIIAGGEKTDAVPDYLKRSRGRKADEALEYTAFKYGDWRPDYSSRPKTVTVDATHWAPSTPRIATTVTTALISSIITAMVVVICS